MGQWKHEEALQTAFSRPVTGRVIAARLHVRHCARCTEAVGSLLTALDAAEEVPLWQRDTQQGLWVNLGALLKATSYRPALATRAIRERPAREPREVIYQFSIGAETTGNMDVDIAAYRDEAEPSLCMLVARVEIPDRWPELAGTEVIMQQGAEVCLALTDDRGQVSFEHVLIDALMQVTLHITPPPEA